MASQFEPDGKRQLAGLLGFDENKILSKAEQFLGAKPGSTLQGPPPEQQAPAAAAPAAAAPQQPMLDADAATDFFQMLGEQNEKKQQEEALQKEQLEKEL